MPRLTGTAVAASAVMAAAALALLSQPAAAQTTLTMSSWVSPSHLLTKDVLAVWGQQVEKATNGRVKLQMLPKHPSAAPGTFDAVKDGLVDVSYVTASYTPARHVLPLLPELPGGGATAEINSVAYSRIHWKYLQQVGEYKGVKLLGRLHARAGPDVQHQAADQQGRGPCRHEDPHRRRHCRGDGARARRLGVRQAGAGILRAAHSGVADGTFFPLESIISFKLGSVVKYATLFPGGFYSSAFGFFMNEDKWNKLSKQDQDAITSVSGEALARARRQGLGRHRCRGAGRDEAGRHPDQRRRRPSSSRACKERAKAINDKWVKDATAKGVDGAKVLAEFREEVKRVAAGQ